MKNKVILLVFAFFMVLTVLTCKNPTSNNTDTGTGDGTGDGTGTDRKSTRLNSSHT